MHLLAVLGSRGIVVKCTAAIFFRMVDCIFGQSLTPIENQLHSMTINCVLKTYNNGICIETHNRLHLHTIVYSKWSVFAFSFLFETGRGGSLGTTLLELEL